MFRSLEAVFVDDPIRFPSIGSSASVKDEGLPHPDDRPVVSREYGLVPACGLPEPVSCGSVSSCPRRILLVLVTEEVPLLLFHLISQH